MTHILKPRATRARLPEADGLRRSAETCHPALGCMVAACLVGFALGDARAQSHPAIAPLSLKSALHLALTENPQLQRAMSSVDAAAGHAQQARLWSNPDLVFSAEEWPVEDGGSFSDAKQTVGLEQAIPFPGKRALQSQLGALDLKLATAALDLQRRELARDVKIAYYEVLAAERRAVVARELVAMAEAAARAAAKRIAAGAAADPEQLRAEVLVEQSQAEVSAIDHECIVARQTLALHLGRPDLVDIPLDGTLHESADLTLLEGAPDANLDEHPAMRAAQATREHATLEWRQAKLAPYPDLTVGVAGGRAGESGPAIIELGLALPLPLFDRGANQVLAARAMMAGSDADATASAQQLRHAWAVGAARLRAAAQQAASYRDRILPKADEALRLVQIGFEQGRFELMDLLDTQRTAAETRLDYQLKLLELHTAQAELETLCPAQKDDAAPTPIP